MAKNAQRSENLTCRLGDVMLLGCGIWSKPIDISLFCCGTHEASEASEGCLTSIEKLLLSLSKRKHIMLFPPWLLVVPPALFSQRTSLSACRPRKEVVFKDISTLVCLRQASAASDRTVQSFGNQSDYFLHLLCFASRFTRFTRNRNQGTEMCLENPRCCVLRRSAKRGEKKGGEWRKRRNSRRSTERRKGIAHKSCLASTQCQFHRIFARSKKGKSLAIVVIHWNKAKCWYLTIVFAKKNS